MSDVVAVLVPQVNVNDVEVRLVQWQVDAGTVVAVGQVLCVVETSKAAAEITSDAAGVFLPLVEIGSVVAVGQPLGHVGPSAEAIETWRARADVRPSLGAVAALSATPRARALAGQLGVPLAEVAASGSVSGTIKESDVRRFAELSRRSASTPAPSQPLVALPTGLRSLVGEPVTPSRHQLAVIENLEITDRSIIRTTLDYRLEAATVRRAIERSTAATGIVSLQHLVIAALGRVLPRFACFTSFRLAGQVYTYRQQDIGFVVRGVDGKLYTPVVRNVAQLTVPDVVRACTALAMRVNRGLVGPEHLDGACFTVSYLSDPRIRRFEALPNRHQSAILAITGGGSDNEPTLTLSYDHGLADGTEAAQFLNAISTTIESQL